MHRIRSVLQRLNLMSAPPGASVLEVATTMADSRVGAIPIIDDHGLVGMFSERDLMTRVVVAGRDPAMTTVGEVMSHDVVTATPEETVDFCLEKMRKGGCRHLPVLVGGKVIAVISMRDLLADELLEQETEIQSLRAFLHQLPRP